MALHTQYAATNRYVIMDSDSTSNFFMVDDPCEDIKPHKISLANAITKHSIHTCKISHYQLLEAARFGHKDSNLGSYALLSIATFIDAGHEVWFEKVSVLKC